MGVPTSEVGYTIATTRRETTKVHKNMWWHWKKKRRYCVATDIIKNTTEELKRLSQSGFHECFQRLYSSWQKCLVAQGDYFEGNVAQMIALISV